MNDGALQHSAARDGQHVAFKDIAGGGGLEDGAILQLRDIERLADANLQERSGGNGYRSTVLLRRRVAAIAALIRGLAVGSLGRVRRTGSGLGWLVRRGRRRDLVRSRGGCGLLSVGGRRRGGLLRVRRSGRRVLRRLAGDGDVVLDTADALHIRGYRFGFLALLVGFNCAGQRDDSARGGGAHGLILEHGVVRNGTGNRGLEVAVRALREGSGSGENPKAESEHSRNYREYKLRTKAVRTHGCNSLLRTGPNCRVRGCQTQCRPKRHCSIPSNTELDEKFCGKAAVITRYNGPVSVVEDVRKALQDFLAPELRAVAAQLDAIDSRLAAQDKVLAAHEKAAEARQNEMLSRIAAQDKTAEARHNELLARIEGLKNSFEIDKRIEKLENRKPS